MNIDNYNKKDKRKRNAINKPKETNEINKKIARDATEAMVQIKIKDLPKVKGKEVIRELKQRLKEPEAKVGIVRKEERTRPIATVEIDGSRIEALMDTGADVSVMSQDIFEQLELVLESSYRPIQGITGKRIKNLGKAAKVPIEVLGKIIPTDIEIIEERNMFILGRDWMKK